MRSKKYTREILVDAIKDSSTWADVCRKVGVPPYTGSQTHLKKRAEDWNIDSSHFLGQAHWKGKTVGPRRSIEEYLSNRVPIKSHELKNKLIKEGLKSEECEICEEHEWNGEKIPLELDHKNSDHFDNRIENLQIICPNCHAIETRKRRQCRPTGRSHQF